MNKKRLGMCFLIFSLASLVLFLLFEPKLFPDVEPSRVARYIVMLELFIFLFYTGVTLVLAGTTEEAGRMTTSRDAQETETPAKPEQNIIAQLQEKWGLSEEETAKWRAAEEERRQNPKRWPLDL